MGSRAAAPAGGTANVPDGRVAERQALMDLVEDAFLGRRPLCTAALIVAVHGVFWHLVTTERTLLSTTSYSLLIVASLRACAVKCPSPHKGLSKAIATILDLGASDLPRPSPVVGPIAREAAIAAENFCVRVWSTAGHLRRSQPGEFAKYTVVLCAVTGTLGALVSGQLLAYVAAIGVLSAPAVRHYNVLGSVRARFQQLEVPPAVSRLCNAVVAPPDVDNSDIFGKDGALATDPFGAMEDSLLDASFARALTVEGFADLSALERSSAEDEAPTTPTAPSVSSWSALDVSGNVLGESAAAEDEDVDISDYAVIDSNRLDVSG